METKEFNELRLKLLGDPDNGVEPTMSIAEMDPQSDEYKAVRPYAMGLEEWPEYVAPVEEPVAPVVDDAPPADEPAPIVIETEAPAIVEARDRVKLRETAREAFEAKVATIQEVLDRPKPADKFSDEYEQWQEDRQQALVDMNLANGEYIRARDVEDIESGRGIVQKSEVATTIKAIGTSYPELALPYSYEDGVNQYNAWAAKASAEAGGDLQAAYAKFQADPEFAKKVGPLPANHEILFIYMNAAAAEKKGGTFKGHVLALADDEGIFAKARAKAATAAAQTKTQAERDADALTTRATEQRPPKVSGSQDTITTPIVKPHPRMTEEQAMEWLENYNTTILGKPMTATERMLYTEQRNTVMSVLTKSGAQSAY